VSYYTIIQESLEHKVTSHTVDSLTSGV